MCIWRTWTCSEPWIPKRSKRREPEHLISWIFGIQGSSNCVMCVWWTWTCTEPLDPKDFCPLLRCSSSHLLDPRFIKQCHVRIENLNLHWIMDPKGLREENRNISSLESSQRSKRTFITFDQTSKSNSCYCYRWRCISVYLNTGLIFLEQFSARVFTTISFQEFLGEPSVKTLVIFALQLSAAFTYAVHFQANKLKTMADARSVRLRSRALSNTLWSVDLS